MIGLAYLGLTCTAAWGVGRGAPCLTCLWEAQMAEAATFRVLRRFNLLGLIQLIVANDSPCFFKRKGGLDALHIVGPIDPEPSNGGFLCLPRPRRRSRAWPQRSQPRVRGLTRERR